MISHSNSPHRLHKDVAALQKFIFGIHSNFRVKICYSDTLVCLSSLWLGKELSQFHLEMGEYWNQEIDLGVLRHKARAPKPTMQYHAIHEDIIQGYHELSGKSDENKIINQTK